MEMAVSAAVKTRVSGTAPTDMSGSEERITKMPP
jgi:hypothetical protein